MAGETVVCIKRVRAVGQSANLSRSQLRMKVKADSSSSGHEARGRNVRLFTVNAKKLCSRTVVCTRAAQHD